MAGAGYRNWTPGDIPTATQFDTFLQEQTVMVFASAAARDTALSVVKAEGMFTYQLDSNTLTVYTGAAWSTVGPVNGALTAWTPTVAQGGAVTVTVDTAVTVYSRVGRTVDAWFNLSVTGTGTGTNAVVVTVPVTAASSSPQLVIGEGFVYDSSATLKYKALMVMASIATGMAFIPTDGAGNSHLGETGGGFIAGLASGDLLAGHISYPAAAD